MRAVMSPGLYQLLYHDNRLKDKFFHIYICNMGITESSEIDNLTSRIYYITSLEKCWMETNWTIRATIWLERIICWFSNFAVLMALPVR